MSDQRVVVLNGKLSGRQFAIDGEMTLGRQPQNTIVLDDTQVSRRHASLSETAQGVVLKDLGSGNGTYLHGHRIVEVTLNDGDAFKIGPFELRYEKQAAESAAGRRTDALIRFEAGQQARIRAKVTDKGPAGNLFQSLLQPAACETHGDDSQLRSIKDKLTAVYAANQIICQEHELKRLFERVMDQIFRLVPANNAVILLRAARSGELQPVCQRSAESDDAISVSMTIINQVMESGEAVLVEDAMEDSRFQGAGSVMEQSIASAMCVPLINKEERLGVVYVDTHGTPYAFSSADLDLIVALAGPSSIAIKNAQYVEQLEGEFETTLRLLANAIEMRDHYTAGHTWRVTLLSLEIAKELGWSAQKLRELEIGGVLHDVGKIALSDKVLNNPGKLSDEEYAHMQIHPEKGAALMRDSERLSDFIPYCLYHHERYDGKGYPHGLQGENIPIEGRVVAVADAFDAMTSNRPYRPARDPESAVEELKANKGKQFDPVCVDAFVRAFDAGRIHNILQAHNAGDAASLACPFCSTYVRAPEGSEAGDVFSCMVCRRKLMLKVETSGSYSGVLLTESDIQDTASGESDSKLDKLRKAITDEAKRSAKKN
jgi:HD-GYP domain-containing protein (c-di-GMP phosphodiesterase class II)